MAAWRTFFGRTHHPRRRYSRQPAAAKPEVWLSARQSAGQTEIRIEDNGPGVSAEVAESLFQPFFTTKPQGAGVGLNLARQIALSHGGDLTLVPTPPGHGAVFRLVM